MHSDVYVKFPIFLSDFNQTWIILTDFIKIPNIKFHWNPSCGSRFDTFRETDGRKDGQDEENRRFFATTTRKRLNIAIFILWKPRQH